MINEFKKFIARGNVIDLAVGILMGTAFTAIVTSMVGDLVMPVIGYAMRGVDFSNFFIALDGGTYETLQAAKDAGAPVIGYGRFINAVLNFLIVAIVVFFIVRNVNKLKKEAEEAPSGTVEPPADIKLLGEIRDLLKKE